MKKIIILILFLSVFLNGCFKDNNSTQATISETSEEKSQISLQNENEGVYYELELIEEFSYVTANESGTGNAVYCDNTYGFYHDGYDITINSSGINIENILNDYNSKIDFNEYESLQYIEDNEWFEKTFVYMRDNDIWILPIPSADTNYWSTLYKINLDEGSLISDLQSLYSSDIYDIIDDTMYHLTDYGTLWEIDIHTLQTKPGYRDVSGNTGVFWSRGFAADIIRQDISGASPTESEKVMEYLSNNTLIPHIIKDENNELALEVTSSSGDIVIYSLEKNEDEALSGFFASNPDNIKEGNILSVGRTGFNYYLSIVYPEDSDILGVSGHAYKNVLSISRMLKKQDTIEVVENYEESLEYSDFLIPNIGKFRYPVPIVIDGVTYHPIDEDLDEYMRNRLLGTAVPIDSDLPVEFTSLDKSLSPVLLQKGDTFLGFYIDELIHEGNYYPGDYVEETFNIHFDGELTLTADVFFDEMFQAFSIRPNSEFVSQIPIVNHEMAADYIFYFPTDGANSYSTEDSTGSYVNAIVKISGLTYTSTEYPYSHLIIADSFEFIDMGSVQGNS